MKTFDAKKFLDKTQNKEAVEEYLLRRPSIIKKAVEEALSKHVEGLVYRMIRNIEVDKQNSKAKSKINTYQKQAFEKIEKVLVKQIDDTYYNNPEVFEAQINKLAEDQLKRSLKDSWTISRAVHEAYENLFNERVKEGIKETISKNHKDSMDALISIAVDEFMKNKS